MKLTLSNCLGLGTALAALVTCPSPVQAATIEVSGPLTGEIHWASTNTYVLTAYTYVLSGATLSIDPASTGGPEWEEFLHHYNEFCSSRRGVPLFNQTPFLTRDQVRKAFGVRIQQFAARRKMADPKNRMLDSYFRDLLS